MAKTSIIVPKVAEYFQDKSAGQRVDEVLSKLTNELKSFKAADTTLVAGAVPEGVSVSGIFFQTFEADVTTTWLARTAGTITYPSNGQAGGRAFNCVGEGFYEFPSNMPFNPDTLYRIRAKFRMTAAPTNPAQDLVSVGVQGYAADGVTVVDTSGGTTATLAHWYSAADVDMGALTLNAWYAYTGYFMGWGSASTSPSTDAGAPRVMDSSVRYIRPCFRLNHAGGNGTMEIDYISLEVLTEAAEANQVIEDVVNLGTGKIATNKVVEGSITASSISTGKLQAGAVTANEIAANTITASQIAAGTITATQIAANTITASQILAGTITATQIATGTITANEIAAGTITANEITVSSLAALSATLGTVTAGYITNGTTSAAIRLSGTTALPASNYIDFTATGSGTWLKTGELTITAAGVATFAGSLVAATGTYSGSIKADSFALTDSSGTTRGDIYLAGSSVVFRDSASSNAFSYSTTSIQIVKDMDFITSGAALKVGSTVKLTSSGGTWTLAATAGSIVGYMNITLDGTARKLAVYAVS